MKHLVRAILLGCALAGAAAADERFDYVLHCAGCHKLNGSGSTVVPALDEIGRLVALPGGREYIGRVPGVAQAPLDSERLAALLNWLIGEHGGAAPQPLYDEVEIETLRRQPLRDPVAARAALIEDQKDCKDCND